MKKITTLLTLVLLMTMLITTPVLAGSGSGGNGSSTGSRGSGSGVRGSSGSSSTQKNLSMVGTITEVGKNSITVQTINSRFEGAEIEVQVTGNTSYYRWTESGKFAINFGDVEIGDSINVKGTFKDDRYTATKLIYR